MNVYNEIRVINSHPFVVGESPLWDEISEKLYLIDFRGTCIRTVNLDTLEATQVQYSKQLSAIALCNSGKILAAMEDGVYYAFSDGSLDPLWVPEKLKGRRLNDGTVGPDGKFYVGSKDENHEAALYRCSADGDCIEVLAHVGSANGSAWSADGKKFYFCDSPDKELCSYDFCSETGTLTNRRKIIAVPDGVGEFDGMTIDAEDKLWCAVWGAGAVYRIDPEEKVILEKLTFPVSKVSSCVFAGRDLQTLVVTTASIRTDLEEEPLAGCTFAVRVNVAGRVSGRFGDKLC